MKKSSFKRNTGLMGCTESGQEVTIDNIEQLPAGSVVRSLTGEIEYRIIHLHNDLWLFCGNFIHCYDNVERMKSWLGMSKNWTLCHLP